MIKQNELELANIDLEIGLEPNKGSKCYCFDNLSIGHNFGMVMSDFNGFSAKCSSLNKIK